MDMLADTQAVLFDMDGTLLPMDEPAFLKAYFTELAAFVCPKVGCEPAAFVEAVKTGTRAMRANDGSRTNAEVYWSVFSQDSGIAEEVARPLFDEFYAGERFSRASCACSPTPLAREAVTAARKHGLKLALASNPLFPLVGQAARLSWAGLAVEDFDLVTSYETFSHSKANPAYYLDICACLGIDPAHALMVGNAEGQDMRVASEAGLACLLVTDCLEPDPDHPWDGARCTLEQLATDMPAAIRLATM